MLREDLVQLADHQILPAACRLFDLDQHALRLIGDYEGCANLVYEHSQPPLFLRITFRPQRSAALLRAELDFVNHLAQHGVRVAQPVLSRNGELLEIIRAGETPLHLAVFQRGKGMRVPDNNYRYRTDAPIEEYFQNWGQVLGQMHALAKDYHPASGLSPRPDWFTLHQDSLNIAARVPERLPRLRARIQALLDEIKALPKERHSYGLIHGDFNDGNFTVDYTNGEITVFDFDDCCYFWFVYELASAWEGGVGRCMFYDLAKRRAFMAHYMEQVLEGYQRENTLSEDWLARLPLFLWLVQVEEFLYFVQYIDDEDDEETQGRLNYLRRCIEDEIPYLGFFDEIFSPEHPFVL